MLRVAVERATSLSDVLSNKMLASIVGSVKDLPVLPRTFMALHEKLADPNASVKEVVKLVEQDISIAAKNSSAGEFSVFRIAARNFHDEYRGELSGNRHAPEPRLIGRGVSRF